ncbi:hypothetical protein [Metarhizobium album]|nr:hypothetical protein [Rhizobium album]
MPKLVIDVSQADEASAAQDAIVRKQKIEMIVEDCRFAQIVSTGHSKALLIGRRVVDVFGEDPELLIEAISIALRRGGEARAYNDCAKRSAEEDYRQSVQSSVAAARSMASL